ncbi:MAG: PmoA family protein [Candidatus Hydrogenedentes bacterium]|nr:PmoA family protein [Candidatus Hydrogenedentota bacterium]
MAMATPTGAYAAKQGFQLRDTPGSHLDVILDGQPVARYMYAYDPSTEETRVVTYKPYLHVFASDGKTLITKGPGGLYTHHRGIFIGWNEIKFNGKTYDRWHMKGGEIVHQRCLDKKAGPDSATISALIYWNDENHKPLLREERTLTFRRAPAPARLIIGFTTKLDAAYGDIFLGGTIEHAGVHYRPADEVDRSKTLYFFPKENPDPKTDLDYPWVGETYTLFGKQYSVVEMNHPDNPKGTKYSAYRDYGRFGAFFEKEIKSGQSLNLKYEFLISDSEMMPAAYIQKQWDKFAGLKKASPVPPMTKVAAVSKKKKKK